MNLFKFDILRNCFVNDNLLGFFGMWMEKELNKCWRFLDLKCFVYVFVLLV